MARSSRLQKENWEVTSFDGVDSDKMEIYYRSTEDGSINRTLICAKSGN